MHSGDCLFTIPAYPMHSGDCHFIEGLQKRNKLSSMCLRMNTLKLPYSASAQFFGVLPIGNKKALKACDDDSRCYVKTIDADVLLAKVGDTSLSAYLMSCT